MNSAIAASGSVPSARWPSTPCRLRLGDMLLGIGAMVLGVLAMLNVVPVTLTFVALLILGGASAFAATTICGAVLGTFKAGYAKS